MLPPTPSPFLSKGATASLVLVAAEPISGTDVELEKKEGELVLIEHPPPPSHPSPQTSLQLKHISTAACRLSLLLGRGGGADLPGDFTLSGGPSSLASSSEDGQMDRRGRRAKTLSLESSLFPSHFLRNSSGRKRRKLPSGSAGLTGSHIDTRKNKKQGRKKGGWRRRRRRSRRGERVKVDR